MRARPGVDVEQLIRMRRHMLAVKNFKELRKINKILKFQGVSFEDIHNQGMK